MAEFFVAIYSGRDSKGRVCSCWFYDRIHVTGDMWYMTCDTRQVICFLCFLAWILTSVLLTAHAKRVSVTSMQVFFFFCFQFNPLISWNPCHVSLVWSTALHWREGCANVPRGLLISFSHPCYAVGRFSHSSLGQMTIERGSRVLAWPANHLNL